MKTVIVAGGTGGHIYPGIAIAQAFKGEAEILFLGSEAGLERKLIPQAGFKIKLIKARALLRKFSYQAVSAPFVSTFGFFQAFAVLRRFQPDLLIATGGYASFPCVLAAKLLKIKIYLHEQNVLPGFSNRCLRFLADKVFLSFAASQKYLAGKVVGNPVRQEILRAERGVCRKKLGFSDSDKVVLIVGGSQGARRINQAVIAALPSLQTAANLKIIHLVGERDKALIDALLAGRVYNNYMKYEYLQDMSEVIASADLAVSRAGATAIAEFLAKNVPMVLIPFPFSAAGHQEINAKVVEEAGAAITVKDKDFTAVKFSQLIINNDLNLPAMRANCGKLARPRAAEELVNDLVG